MQFFDRSKTAPPAEFRSETAHRERVALLELMQENPDRRSQLTPERHFRFDESALRAVAEVFEGKCAFCESKRPLHIHHFRPPAEAEPLDQSAFAHLYYAWLRTAWNNVYAACEICATSAGKHFPVRGGHRGPLPDPSELASFANENYGLWRWPHRDQAWLLDPCATRSFTAHLAFDLNGGIQARSRAGAETIATYRLDRDDLAASRARAFDDYAHLLREDVKRGPIQRVFDFAVLEHGGAWHLLLRGLAARLAQRLDIEMPTDRRRIAEGFRGVLSTPVGQDAFEGALEEMRQPVVRARRAIARRRGVAPRLIGVGLRNFKALEKLDLVIPPPVAQDLESDLESEAAALLILGENAAGKSSILEAVALASCGANVRQRLGKAPASFILDPDMMGLAGGQRPPQSEVALNFQDGTTHKLTISDRFEDSDPSFGFPAVYGYGAFRQYAGKQKVVRLGRIGTLFRPSLLLPNPEEWLLGLDEAQFAMVARALHRLFTIEGEVDVILPDRPNGRCMVVTQVGTGADAKTIRTPLAVVSSGFRSVLAMVCDIFEGLLRDKEVRTTGFSGAQPIILIDEIEAHLHPRWKMQIMAAFRKVLPRAIIIATSHDPLCLRGMHGGEVVVLSRAEREDDAPDRVPVVVETIAELPDVENLTIEQLLTSDFFAMFSTDSPDAERKLGQLGDLLARRESGDRLTEAEKHALGLLEREVAEALPLGSSEVQRIVQRAVADYLQQRRKISAAQLTKLEAKTRALIVDALEGI